MDYPKIAQQVLDRVGGPANILSAAHCATRLRLVIETTPRRTKRRWKM